MKSPIERKHRTRLHQGQGQCSEGLALALPGGLAWDWAIGKLRTHVVNEGSMRCGPMRCEHHEHQCFHHGPHGLRRERINSIRLTTLINNYLWAATSNMKTPTRLLLAWLALLFDRAATDAWSGPPPVSRLLLSKVHQVPQLDVRAWMCRHAP